MSTLTGIGVQLRAGIGDHFHRNAQAGSIRAVRDRLRALCEVLGLELYVGRPRGPQLLDERRLELAVETAERGLAASGQTLSHADKARFFVAVYQLIGHEHAPANVARVRQILRMVTSGNRGSDPDSPVAGGDEMGER